VIGHAGKPRLAIYWASACGGCEVSLLNIGEKILLFDDAFELVFCPCLADFKLEDVRGYPDEHIDLCLFNGAIHSTENREMAHLLRRKSRILVAFGSCAHEGCVPGLANLTSPAAILEAVYRNGAFANEPHGPYPRPASDVPEGRLELPILFETVMTLEQVEPVDYFIPGCPPESPRVWEVLELFTSHFLGKTALPAAGSVLGATDAAVCEECPRERFSRQVARFYRPFEITPEPGTCLLDQGLVCMGVATRGGCGALCPRVGMGCRGCYGTPEGAVDQGARMIAALAAVLTAGSPQQSEATLVAEVETAMATVIDPAGTFYRYSLAHSLLQRARVRDDDAQAPEGP
jgi:F420-non-reducing hydrogenase small subunit